MWNPSPERCDSIFFSFFKGRRNGWCTLSQQKASLFTLFPFVCWLDRSAPSASPHLGSTRVKIIIWLWCHFYYVFHFPFVHKFGRRKNTYSILVLGCVLKKHYLVFSFLFWIQDWMNGTRIQQEQQTAPWLPPAVVFGLVWGHKRRKMLPVFMATWPKIYVF